MTATELWGTVLAALFASQDVLHPSHPVWQLAVANLLLVLPLLASDRHPAKAYWIILGLVVIFAPWDYRLTGAIALVPALASLAAHRGPGRIAFGAAALETGLITGAYLVGGPRPWLTALALTAVLAAATTAGLTRRQHRTRSQAQASVDDAERTARIAQTAAMEAELAALRHQLRSAATIATSHPAPLERSAQDDGG